MLRSLLIAALFLTGPVRAQVPDTLSDHATISVISTSPGPLVYEMYGHSAFRVSDPVTGADQLFNYGTFDFEQPAFIPRFAYGRLEYYLSSYLTPRSLRDSRIEGRTVVEQVLNLSRAERDSMYAFLLHNAHPDNRSYRYDFLFDNCATRVRDVIETVTGNRILWGGDPGAGRTFRELLQVYAQDRPWLGAGIDLALGSSVDRPATPRESAFLPELLVPLLAGSAILTGEQTQPLVVRTDTLATLIVAPTDEMPAWLPSWPTLSGWLLFMIVVLVTIRERYRHRTRRPIELTDRLVFALTGVAGLVLGFLVFISEHEVTSPNWNLLWATPSHLLVSVLPGRVPKQALTIYFGLTAVGCLAVLLSPLVLPQFIPGIAFPLTASLLVRAVRGMRIARGRQPFHW